VDAEKLLVHDGSKWKSTEGLHTRFIDLFRIFVLAFKLESEIVG